MKIDFSHWVEPHTAFCVIYSDFGFAGSNLCSLTWFTCLTRPFLSNTELCGESGERQTFRLSCDVRISHPTLQDFKAVRSVDQKLGPTSCPVQRIGWHSLPPVDTWSELFLFNPEAVLLPPTLWYNHDYKHHLQVGQCRPGQATYFNAYLFLCVKLIRKGTHSYSTVAHRVKPWHTCSCAGWMLHAFGDCMAPVVFGLNQMGRNEC